MASPYSTLSKNEIKDVIKFISEQAISYLETLDTRPIRSSDPHRVLEVFNEPIPELGSGAIPTLQKLINQGLDAATTSSGPRFFHFVTGGTTPAALGADWLASTIDQNAYAWVSSALATKLESISIKWLLNVFHLPENWGGVITTGTTMSNFVCLAAARQWIGQQQDVDISEQGLLGIKSIPIFSSDIIHPSDTKALGMLGIGRSSVLKLSKPDSPTFDITKLEKELQKLNGAPSIIIGVAGEPNAGEFDDIKALADLAETYGAWLHVDGAFGAFAQVTKDYHYLTEGVERGQSLAVDGHKWLNVPYDAGFAFVNNPDLLVKNFTFSADYLPEYDSKEQVFGSLGPEMSRRARSFAIWSTLHAYGRAGVTEIVEHNINLARYLGQIVDQESKLELLAPVVLNVVCFRYFDSKFTEQELDKINANLGDEILKDGRVFLGITKYKGKVALRPAISNWRTEKQDIDLLFSVVLELGNKCSQQIARKNNQ